MATLDQIKAELVSLQTALTQLIADVNTIPPPVVIPPPPPPPPPPLSHESVDGTVLNSTASQIIDASGAIWTLVNGTGLEVQQNGTAAGYTANVALLLYSGHTIYQSNASGGWWSWTNGGWVDANDPRVGPGPNNPPAPAGSVVQVDLTANLGNVSPFVFGVGTEGFDSPGNNDYGAALNSGFQATYKAQNWRLFRFNTEGTVGPWYNNSSPTDNWFRGSANFWDNTNNRLVFTLGSGHDDVSPSQAVSIANYFKSKGQECFYYEFWNEPDGDSDVNTYCNKFNAVQSALKSINPNYKLGGPTTTYVRGDWLGTFASKCHPDFISYHAYFTGGFSDNRSLFQKALGASGAVDTVRQYFDQSIPIFLGEYNIDYNGTEHMMQTIDGGLFVALYCYGSMSAKNANVTMGAIWTIGENNQFTIVSNDGSNVRPAGSVLGILGRKMGGTKAQVSVGTGLSNLRCMASYNGTNWAVWLINFDTGTDYTINLKGLSGTNYQYWECSPAHNPLTSTAPIANLAALKIPSRSVIVVSSN